MTTAATAKVASKKTRARRAAAAALLVAGMAGLGMASASQLNFTQSGFGTGKTMFIDDVQQEGAYSLSFNTTWNANAKDYDVSAVTVGNVAQDAGKTFAAQLVAADDSTPVGQEVTGTIEGNSIVIPVPAGTNSDALGGIAMTVHD